MQPRPWHCRPTGIGRPRSGEWACAHGRDVSDRGRLSAEVTAAYNAAH